MECSVSVLSVQCVAVYLLACVLSVCVSVLVPTWSSMDTYSVYVCMWSSCGLCVSVHVSVSVYSVEQCLHVSVCMSVYSV